MTVTNIYGKAPPDEFEEWSQYSFNGFETHLKREDFDDFAQLKRLFQQYATDISVVHTPHVMWPEDKQLFQQSVSLAQLVGAQLCIHSSYVSPVKASEIDNELSISVTYGYESSLGHSYEFIENVVFTEDLPFVLDVAHFYTGNPSNYLDTVDDLLTRYGEQISLVHFCDSTTTVDGLPLGEGELPVDDLWELLQQKYYGPVTLEVGPDHQLDALNYVQSL